ncbi:MAG: 2-oxoacid:acceptor oxidoreductase family protein, partial [Candidatus Woesearchaeota archaeon]
TSDGILLENTSEKPSDVKKKTGFKGKIYTLDASKIAVEEYQKNVPNTPLLGAIVKATEIVEIDDLKNELEIKMKSKLGDEVLQKNIKALDRAYQELNKD